MVESSGSSSRVGVDEVLKTTELRRRQPPGFDFEAECDAILRLSSQLADDPGVVLQGVVETVTELSPAESAGISILRQTDEDEDVFHWEAIAGPFARNRGELRVGSRSPCGLVVERDATVLFDRPGRHYVELADLEPSIFEALMVPFHIADEPVGALWALGHGPDVRFDAGDARLLRDLSSFASASHQLFDALTEAKAARREAEEADRTKSEFMATVSHELRTPLNAIIGYTELLLEGVPEELPEGVRTPVERISYGAHHLRHLIEEVLTFSRLQAGKGHVQEREISPTDLLEEIEAVVEPLVRQTDVELVLDARGAPRPIRTDERKLRQILLNLLGNAVKFTEKGTVGLRIFERGGRVVFQVFDTGAGISPQAQERVFEAFWQGRKAQMGSAGGTGLGLAISRRYAEMLGGDLTVESAPEEGSTFTLSLPHSAADTVA